MKSNRDHPLFRAFPLQGTVKTSAGELPIPYHVYDGHALLVAGTVDAAVAADCIKDEDVHLVLTQSGKALMGVFICDFTDASLGPHLELQVSVLVRDKPGPRLSASRVAYMAALGSDPEIGSLCLGLWNDTDAVLAYNSEYLGLDAKLCSGEIKPHSNRLAFDFQDETGQPLISGDVRKARFSGLKIVFETIKCMGLKTFFDVLRQPWARADVINRKDAKLPRNGRAQTRTKADQMVLQYVDQNDRITLSHPALAAFGFEPRCLQHLSPFRFVYLHPDAS